MPEPVFEGGLKRTLGECMNIGTERGAQYADSWALENLHSAFTAQTLNDVGDDRSPEALRLIILAALCDTKISRITSGGPYKRDSYVDGLNYQAVLCDLREQYEAKKFPP